MIVHHTNKPPKDADKRAATVASDFAYLGAGSAELANWARAVLSVREIAPGQFELRASKRGRRAGLEDTDGRAATEIFLKHGEQGICWERSAAPEEERNEAEQADADDVIASMKPEHIYSRTEIRGLVEQTLGVKKAAVMTRGRRAHRVYHLVLEQTKHANQPSGHMVTSGHKNGL